MSNLLFVVSTVGENDHTPDLHLPDAIRKFESRGATLKQRDGNVHLNWENNDWKRPTGSVWVPLADAVQRVTDRMAAAQQPGADAFLRGDRGAKGPTYRIRSVERGEEFNYTGEISAPLRKLCEDLWAEFGSDPSLANGGVHVCRKIAGSTSWSQHAWDDAIDLMIGSDMHLGDQIVRWLKSHEGKYGGYCELLWRVPSHSDHVHLSLAPCHNGTPPCA